MTATALADELRSLAAQVRRLMPDRRDPEAFHMSKDEAVASLLRAAREIERDEIEVRRLDRVGSSRTVR